MTTITFLGKNSYDDFGLITTKTPSIPMPQRRVTYDTIPGRNGTLTEDEETYDDITITVDFSVISDNIPQIAGQIKAWLADGQGKLIFSNDPNYYYIAQVVNKFDIAQSIMILGEFTVVFNAKPFKKALDDTNYIILDQCVSRAGNVINPLSSYNFVGGTALANNTPVQLNTTKQVNINNPGTVDSAPILNIVGSGDISVTLGSSTFSLENLDDYVTVNTEMQNAYKDTALRNNIMIGDFPTLPCGDNAVSWSGAVASISIQCNSNWI